MIFSRTPVSEALAAVFKGRGAARSRQISGGCGEGETPLPIPNRAVKPLSADGTWPARARESRSPPVLLLSARLRSGAFSLRAARPVSGTREDDPAPPRLAVRGSSAAAAGADAGRRAP